MKTTANTLTTKGEENEHKITEYNFISDVNNGKSRVVTLGGYYNDLLQLSRSARCLSDMTEDEIKNAKVNQLKSCVFAELKDDYKSNENFISRSLLSIDIDQGKAAEEMSYNSIIDRVADLNLDVIMYTTISHKVGNTCCRIILDIGVLCDEKLFKQATQWFKEELNLIDGFDDASTRQVQAMILPVAYMYEKPRVDRIEGRTIADMYADKVNSIQQNFGGNTSSCVSKLLNSHINIDVKDRFQQQVNLLHKPLKLHQVTNSSTQFHRNSIDKGAGLFITHDKKVVHDASRDKDKYPLYYSMYDFHESEQHMLTTRDQVYDECISWEKATDVNYAVFQENAGSGKSNTLKRLSKLLPKTQRRIYTFHTRANRDSFFDDDNTYNCVLIYGNVELIGEVINDPNQLNKINIYLREYYDGIGGKLNKAKSCSRSSSPTQKTVGNSGIRSLENQMLFSKVLQKLLDENLINQRQKEVIQKLVKDNRNNMDSSKHLVMTTKKFEYAVSFGGDDTFNEDIIYTDEVYQGMLTNIPKDTSIPVYYNFDADLDETISIDYDRLRNLKRCLISVEESIVYELNHLEIPFKRISKPVKTYDPNLEIAIVRSTSSQVISEDQDKTKRNEIYECIKKVNGCNVNIISDGLSEQGCTLNHTNTKGINRLSSGDNIIILAFPSPSELANAMYCTGLGEDAAKHMIISDKFNQAVGRNMGYRNKSEDSDLPSTGNNHCLVVIPDKLYLDMHNVTSLVTRVSHWNVTNNTSKITEDNRSKFYFEETIANLSNITKATNQKNTQTSLSTTECVADVIYYTFSHVADHGSKRISLKEIEAGTGISKSKIKMLCKQHIKLNVVKCRPWNAFNDSKLDCVKLDNRYLY